MLRLLLSLSMMAVRVAVRRARRGPLRPTWSFLYEAVVATLKSQSAEVMKLQPPQMRARWNGQAAYHPIQRKVRVSAVDAGGVRAFWIEPRHKVPARTVLYFHGGAFIYGSLKTHGELVARLALAADARVLFVDYRLAPECPFPAPVEDAVAAYRFLLGSGADARSVVFAGDSAGAALVVATLCAAREAKLPLPAAGVLLCPWVDLTRRGGTLVSNSPYDWAEPEDFQTWARLYLGSQDATDPRASVLLADLRGLPPLLVQAGTAEMLFAQASDFVARAREQGVEAQLSAYTDQVHNWHLFAGFFGESRRAIDEIGAFAAAHAST